MSRTANPEAKVLGTVNPDQFHAIGYFFDHGHFDRLAKKLWPANLRTLDGFSQVKSPIELLDELNPLLEALALEGTFTRESKDVNQSLGRPYGAVWTKLLTSATQAVGRSHLERTDPFPPASKIVTQDELRRALNLSGNSLTIHDDTFMTPRQRNPYGKYAIPGDTVFQPDEIGGVGLKQMADYLSALPDRLTLRLRELTNTYTSRGARKGIRDAVGDIFNLDSGWINIPSEADTPPEIKIIVGSGNFTQIRQDHVSLISAGMPNMEVFSFWLLRILTGKIPQQSDWRRYFT